MNSYLTSILIFAFGIGTGFLSSLVKRGSVTEDIMAFIAIAACIAGVLLFLASVSVSCDKRADRLKAIEDKKRANEKLKNKVSACHVKAIAEGKRRQERQEQEEEAARAYAADAPQRAQRRRVQDALDKAQVIKSEERKIAREKEEFARRIQAKKEYSQLVKFGYSKVKIENMKQDEDGSYERALQMITDHEVEENALSMNVIGDKSQRLDLSAYKKTDLASAPTILYYLKVKAAFGRTLYKIGVTSNSVDRRYASDNQVEIEVIAEELYDTGMQARAREKHYKDINQHVKYKGPQILVAGDTELFTEDILGLDLVQEQGYS